MGRSGALAPLALMVHDEANKVTLCRIFRVGDQRLSLIAVSASAQLPYSADPALVKVDAVISSERHRLKAVASGDG